MIFELDETELKKFKKWKERHNKTCPFKNPMKQGAIGGRFTYSFCPTGVGVTTVVKCACGEKIDLTDYDNW